MDKRSLHFVISGRVQGVGFRYYTYAAAQKLNITGYVKNLYNGNVEIFAEGNTSTLYKFLDNIKQGPSLSNVLDIDITWNDIKNIRYKQFTITY